MLSGGLQINDRPITVMMYLWMPKRPNLNLHYEALICPYDTGSIQLNTIDLFVESERKLYGRIPLHGQAQ